MHRASLIGHKLFGRLSGGGTCFHDGVLLKKGKMFTIQPLSTKSMAENIQNDASDSDNIIAKNLSIIGWITSIRQHKTRVFFDLSDGTSPHTLQVICPVCTAPQKLTIGSAVEIRGTLRESFRPSDLQKQRLSLKSKSELHANRVKLLCPPTSDEDNHVGAEPGQSLKGATGSHTPRPDLGLLRSVEGLAWRHRLPEFAAVLRLRAHMKRLLRSVMSDMEYLEVDTPILTTTDCEGRGQTFLVQSPAQCNSVNELPLSPDSASRSVYLTGSAQLHLEALVLGMSKVFTLSPAFRAETSHTRHHLAEFHMLEIESVHLTSVDCLCNEIEVLVRTLLDKFLHSLSLADNEEDANSGLWADIMYDLFTVNSSLSSEKNWSGRRMASDSGTLDLLLGNLRAILARPFARITFLEAVSHLRPDTPSDYRHSDFSKEEEHRLVNYFGANTPCPVFVTHFPVYLKPFYCRSEDGYWAEAVDLLVPGVGELVGGSVRETSHEVLLRRLSTKSSVDQCSSLTTASFIHWYVEQLRHSPGAAPHGGFGLGFERMLQWLSGVYSIRDLIAFPRQADKIIL